LKKFGYCLRLTHRPAALALPVTALLWAGSALAQPSPQGVVRADPRPTLQALDPRTPVPQVTYQSALTGLTRGVETGNVDWRRANDEVGQFQRGHIDLLKLEQAGVAPGKEADPPPAANHTNPMPEAATPPLRLPQPGEDNSAELALLLGAPVSAEAAVRIALLNHPGLLAFLGDNGVNISSAVPADHPAKYLARQQMARLSTQVRQAWVHAVAANQSLGALTRAREAAEASGELARRLARTGNWSRLQQARRQVMLVEAASDELRAKEAAYIAREQLALLLGVWGPAALFELPADLPELPAQVRELPDIESLALQARPDIALAGVLWQRQRNARSGSGPDAFWDALRDDARLRDMALKARSQARQSYQRYRSRYELARLAQDENLPLRQFISDEMLLRYNGMLSSVFDVLADTRAQALATHSAIQATRDFWLADADLQSLLAGAPTQDTTP
jgi:hypothetical protein